MTSATAAVVVVDIAPVLVVLFRRRLSPLRRPRWGVAPPVEGVVAAADAGAGGGVDAGGGSVVVVMVSPAAGGAVIPPISFLRCFSFSRCSEGSLLCGYVCVFSERRHLLS